MPSATSWTTPQKLPLRQLQSVLSFARCYKARRSTDHYCHAYSDTLLDVVQKMDGNVVDLKKKGMEKAQSENE